MKMGIVKAVNIVGFALGIVGTVCTGWAGNKIMQDTILKEVAKQTSKH